MKAAAAAYYFCIFGALGAWLPFLPVALDGRGFSASEIAAVLVVMPISDVLVPPVWGFAADRLHLRPRLMALACLGSGLTILLLIFPGSLAFTIAATTGFCVFRAAVVPLGDAAARAMLSGRGEGYGLVRVWGSIGFACSALGVGVAKAPPAVIFTVAGVLYAGGSIATRWIPVSAPLPRPNLAREALAHAMQPVFLLFLLGTLLHYAGHSTYDAFVSLHLIEIGFSKSLVGLAWTLGVAGEIVLLFLTPRLLKRFDPVRMLVVCATVAGARWLVLAFVSNPAILLATQFSHALTFGLWYVCGVYFTQALAPDDLRSTLQALMIAAIGGGRIIGYLVGGHLFDEGGGRAVYLAAAVAAAAAVLTYVALSIRVSRQAPLTGERAS